MPCVFRQSSSEVPNATNLLRTSWFINQHDCVKPLTTDVSNIIAAIFLYPKHPHKPYALCRHDELSNLNEIS